MPTITDFTKLRAIDVIFGPTGGDPNLNRLIREFFNNTLENDKIGPLFKDNDLTKGLLPKTDLFVALRRLIVDNIILPEAYDTQDVKQLDIFSAKYLFS